jgi:integrase
MPKLAKRKDSPNYYAWVTDPVTQHKVRRSTRQANQRTAGAVAERRERSAFSSYNPTTLEEAIHAFLTQVAVKKAKATVDFYRKKCEAVSTLLGARRDMATIEATVVDKMCGDLLTKGYLKSGIGKLRLVLRLVCKHARRHKHYPHAIDEVFDSWPSQSVSRTRWCTPEEVWAIMAELPVHRAVVVAFHVACGANLGESMRARYEDIDVAGKQVFIRGTKRSTRLRFSPVMEWNQPFLEYVRANTPSVKGRPMFRDWYKAMRWDLKRVCEKLGIPGVSSNDLRRSYAEWLNQRDVSAKLIGATLGHAPGSKVTEQTYIRERGREVRRLIESQIVKDGALEDKHVEALARKIAALMAKETPK